MYIDIENHSNPVFINRGAGSIKSGLYGWNGTCFIWGTLYTGDNGDSIFVPADYTTQSLLNVCPGNEQAFSKSLSH